MRRLTVVELRANLARWLRRAGAGERIVVVRHEEPVATLGPPPEIEEEVHLTVPVAAEPGAAVARQPHSRRLPAADRLALFDAATERQRARERAAPRPPATERGWTREELYARDRAR